MIFIGIFVLLILILITQPLLIVIYFKLKYGKRVIVQYFPILGISRPFSKSKLQYNDPLYSVTKLISENKQADMLITNLLFKPLIVFLKPEYYKIFMQNHHEYDKFKMIVDKRIIDKGMIMERGPKWQQQRKLLGSHFDYSKLINLIPMINDVADEKITNVTTILPIVSSITGEVVLRAFFGQDIAKLSLNGEDPTKSVTMLFTRFGQLIVQSPFFLLKRAFLEEKVFTLFPRKVESELYNLNTEMLNHMKKAINNRLEKLKNQKIIEHQDYLDVYLDAYLNHPMDPPITEEEILQQSITLYFAGTETTANLISTTCYYLAEHPDIQQELYEEVKNVIGTGPVTAKHLLGLQKVTGFLMECLRLRPVAPMLISKKSLKDHYIQDIFIKKGWYINYMALSNHMNEKYFPNPTQFDITRWKADGTPKDLIDPFAFIPFSAGGRNCIGQHLAMIEAKIILCKILLKYKLLLNEKIQTDWILKITYGLACKEYVKWELR